MIFGAASGPADPFSPNSFMPNALTVSGGSLQNYLRTNEELMQRANRVITEIRAGWLKLNIGRVLPLAQAAQAHELPGNSKDRGQARIVHRELVTVVVRALIDVRMRQTDERLDRPRPRGSLPR